MRQTSNSDEQSTRQSREKVDWLKFTDFKSRHTVKDLEKLCSQLSQQDLEDVWSTRDKRGFAPIHWASINNRSDMIDFMVRNNAEIHLKCKNKLLADGTALHLAAMNGSIEAASILMDVSQRQAKEKESRVGKERKVKDSDGNSTQDFIEKVDRDGMTPLMKCAAPRIKRMDTARDLLKKNLWSLNARPAEMALYLISRGANWRKKDSKTGMSLFHLSIINNCDDIVNLLLVIDSKLLNQSINLESLNHEKTHRSYRHHNRINSYRGNSQSKTKDDESIESVKTEHISIKGKSISNPSNDKQFLYSSSISENDRDSSSSSYELLSKNNHKSTKVNQTKIDVEISKRNHIEIPKSISPLDLAIVYGRVELIGLLWKAIYFSSHDRIDVFSANQALNIENSQQLVDTVWRVFWSDRLEIKQFFKLVGLRVLLILDLSILCLLWIPGLIDFTKRFAAGVFLFLTGFTLIWTMRVILRDPGFVQNNSVQYLNEIVDLVKDNQCYKDTRNDIGVASEVNNLKKVSQDQSSLQNIDLKQRVRIVCHKCKCIRRPRSRHCNHCNRCVLDFDHHCIYLGTCIGRYNRLDFFLMSFYLTILSLYGVILGIGVNIDATRTLAFKTIALLWIGKYFFIGATNFCSSFRRAYFGVSMYEDIRARRIRSIFGQKNPPETHLSLSNRSFWKIPPQFSKFEVSQSTFTGFSVRKAISNLVEFTNMTSFNQYLFTLLFSDSQLMHSAFSHNLQNSSKIDINRNI